MAKIRLEKTEEGKIKKHKEKKASKDKIIKSDRKDKKERKIKKEKKETKERKKGRKHKELENMAQEKAAIASDQVDAASEVEEDIVEDSVNNGAPLHDDDSSDSMKSGRQRQRLTIVSPVELNLETEAKIKQVETNGKPLFAIDTKKMKIDPAAVRPPTEELAASGLNPDGTPMNRQARRRLKLIDRQKEKIHKELVKEGELDEGSDEFESELQLRTDAWTRDRDEKTGLRLEKKQARKEKNQQKLRNKRGKILTGRRLTERKKEIVKDEKSKARRDRQLAAMDD